MGYRVNMEKHIHINIMEIIFLHQNKLKIGHSNTIVIGIKSYKKSKESKQLGYSLVNKYGKNNDVQDSRIPIIKNMYKDYHSIN